MGQPWSAAHRRNFIRAMKEKFPYGTRGKKRAEYEARKNLLRKFKINKRGQLAINSKANGRAIMLSELRTELFRINEKARFLTTAIRAIEELDREEKRT